MTTARLAKTRIRKATAELAVASSGIKRDLAPWRAAFNRRRTTWIVAGGFASGPGGIAAWLARASSVVK